MNTSRHSLLILAIILLVLAAAISRADVSVVSSLSQRATLTPGGSTTGSIRLHNSSTVAQQVRLYQTDYQYAANGSNQYGDPGTTPRSNAKWITYTPAQLEVPAGSDMEVAYTITVPPDTALIGSYWSLLMVEPLAPEPPPPAPGETGQIQVGIKTVIRYAVSLRTDIGTVGARHLKFGARQLVAQEGKLYLQFDAENTGDFACSPTPWLEAFAADGTSLGRLQGAKIGLLPGCSARYTIDVTSLPKGSYDALFVLDNGDQYVFGTSLKLAIE
jgi:hypothetical protein